MPLATGQLLSAYEILGSLGAGGMGEVYRARDTRLGREVAIKVLPEELAEDEDFRRRFEREARAISRLNHPRICILHDVGEAAGVHYLVLECLEGQTLEERIRRGPIPLREALRLAADIAEALDAAHRDNVIHRDLKPGNVMLSKTGLKLLDFGLARGFQGLSAEAGGEDSTTIGALTATGTLMGTLQYMAPEQLEGQPADARSDIFALGAVLYEMITGRRAFQGDTQGTLIAGILRDEPDPLDDVLSTAPPGVERCLRRCMAKDREERWQCARDLMYELRWLADQLRELRAGGEGSRSKWVRWSPALLAAGIVAAGLAIVFAMSRTTVFAKRVPLRLEVVLPEGTRLNGWASPVVAMSPDERAVAFVADREDGLGDLYVRSLDSSDPVRVPDSETAEGPFFSPDGRWIGFAVGVSARTGRSGELLKYSLDTGLTQSICPLTDYFGAVWGPDDEILFVEWLGEGFWSVPASGGTKRSVLSTFAVDGREEPGSLAWPVPLSGGRHVLATDMALVPREIVSVDLETGEMEALGIRGERAFVPDEGRLFYTDIDGTLFEMPFDHASRVASGAPVAVMDGLSLTRLDVPVLDISANGSFVYSRGYVRGSRIMPSDLVHLDASGSENVLSFDPQLIHRGISVSPSGDRIAAPLRGGSIWVFDLDRGTRTKLPRGDLSVVLPWSVNWSPDGLYLAFTSFTPEGWGLFRQRTNGTAEPEVLLVEELAEAELIAGSWTADGKAILYIRSDSRDEGCSIHRLALDPPSEPELLVEELSDTQAASLSPDGRWLAYDSTETGEFEIYVQDTSVTSERLVVSSDGGRNPVWSQEGGELYYYAENPGRLMSVRVPEPPDDSFGSPGVVFETDIEPWFGVDPKGGFLGYRPVPGMGVRKHLEVILSPRR